jgi:SAM-dependent methyltransferase
MRLALRGVHFGDRHRRLDSLYRLRDPWSMETDAQRFRFRATNQLIEQEFGRVGSILEVGCGEGHQTEHLLTVCDHVLGTEISARAVERARERCPNAEFAVGDVFAGELPASGRQFDLVLGCEVLYYTKDVPAALRRLGELGRACLVSYYERPAPHLDPYVLALPGVRSTKLTFGDSAWTVAWWRTS